MLVKHSGLLSTACTSAWCLTEIEKKTLPEFVVANMLISVSAIDNTHPPTWQWVTMKSKVLPSPLAESCVFVECLTHMFVCVYACACLIVCSVCASVPVSISVSGWAGNGRMKLWQRPVTPTPFLLCAAVSACLISVLRSVAHGEISVSGWAWTVLCRPLCSRSGVYTWQWVGMCCVGVILLCDWGALWLPASVTRSVITLDTWGLRRTHFCESQEES